MSTFLELCQELRSELHLPGGGPSAVTNELGENMIIIRMIRDADLEIKKLWHDWNFLWAGEAAYSVTTSSGSNALSTTKPTNIGNYDLSSFYLNKTSSTPYRLTYVDWNKYSHVLKVGSQTSAVPSNFTIAPDKTVRVWPQADNTYTLTGEYWIKPAALTAPTQVSAIPEEHHRIIIVRAKIMYAEGEDAPEIAAGAAAEFDHLLEKLESDELPAQRQRRMARANEGTDTNRVIVQ